MAAPPRTAWLPPHPPPTPHARSQDPSSRPARIPFFGRSWFFGTGATFEVPERQRSQISQRTVHQIGLNSTWRASDRRNRPPTARPPSLPPACALTRPSLDWRVRADQRIRWVYRSAMSVEDRLDRLEKIVIHLQYLSLLHADFFKGKDEKNSIETLGQLVGDIAAEHGLGSAQP
jgi:hypothetical protein